jgi:hypothetical protein
MIDDVADLLSRTTVSSGSDEGVDQADYLSEVSLSRMKDGFSSPTKARN